MFRSAMVFIVMMSSVAATMLASAAIREGSDPAGIAGVWWFLGIMATLFLWDLDNAYGSGKRR